MWNYVWLILALLAIAELVGIKTVSRQRLAVEQQMQTYYYALYYDDITAAMFDVDWNARMKELAEKASAMVANVTPPGA